MKLSRIFKNRYIQLGVASLSGAVLCYFLLPTKEITKTETVVEVQEKIVTVEVEKIVERVVERESESREAENKKVRKEMRPDGTVIEESETSRVSETLEKSLEAERARSKEAIATLEKSHREEVKKLKLSLNPKKFLLYGGVGLEDLRPQYVLGASYTFLGPLSVGLQYTSDNSVFATIGLQF